MNKSSMSVYVLTLFITGATARAYHTMVNISVVARGVVRPDEDAIKIVTEVTARITEVTVKEGDVVREGDVLVQFDTRDLDLKRRMLESRIQITQERLGRRKERGLEAGSLMSDLTTLREQLQASDIELERYTIASPTAGVIGSIGSFHPGESVTEKTVIGAVVPHGQRLIVETWVPADERRTIESAHVLVAEQNRYGRTHSIDGDITSISPYAQAKGSMMAYRVLIRPLGSYLLQDGVTVEVHFVEGTQRLLWTLFRRARKRT